MAKKHLIGLAVVILVVVGFFGYPYVRLLQFKMDSGLRFRDWIVIGLAVPLMEVLETTHRGDGMRRLVQGRAWWFRWSFYYLLILSMMCFAVTGQSQFIYFQF